MLTDAHPTSRVVPPLVPPGPSPSTRAGWITWLGMAVVLIAAAVLSFAALRDLATAVRIHAELAWLLPIAVDAGAAVSCQAWLSPRSPRDAARFARTLTWGLLALTVAGNAAGQGMAAAGIVPPWWVAVLVGAIPPAVVGGVVHLAVLVGRAPAVAPTPGDPGDDEPTDLLDEHGLSRLWETAPPALSSAPATPAPAGDDRAAELIAAGAGRRRIARELAISEHEARTLLDTHRNGSTR